MRAEYDSRVGTLAIELVNADRADYGDDTIAGAVVHVRSERPVAIDILNTDRLDEALAAIAERYDLDVQVLNAGARSALAVPDRAVDLDVHARATAA